VTIGFVDGLALAGGYYPSSLQLTSCSNIDGAILSSSLQINFFIAFLGGRPFMVLPSL
jgi:hypothetical protein